MQEMIAHPIYPIAVRRIPEHEGMWEGCVLGVWGLGAVGRTGAEAFILTRANLVAWEAEKSIWRN